MLAMHEMWQEPQVQSLGGRKADSNPYPGHVLGVEGKNYLNYLYYSHTKFVVCFSHISVFYNLKLLKVV